MTVQMLVRNNMDRACRGAALCIKSQAASNTDAAYSVLTVAGPDEGAPH